MTIAGGLSDIRSPKYEFSYTKFKVTYQVR